MRLAMFLFFFNDTATTEIYTLSLHDALPIFRRGHPRLLDAVPSPFGHELCGVDANGRRVVAANSAPCGVCPACSRGQDRKSTRLNSSHANISYAVFCLKKKKKHFLSQHTNKA